MKTKRLVFGVLSSLLLAVGFVRAADSLDPVLQNSSSSGQTTLGAADSCTGQCWAIENRGEMGVADSCTGQCWAIGDGS